jgi:nitroimidazol reductase NimA-like FMN-containing flavoprotein (pyridoxamine 5'-phosphate oxidase superfamily)
MIGNLTTMEIDDLLQKQVVGRIGCYADNKVYVVPVSYAYDADNIYVHSYEGLKLNAMRKNPNVCFEVDDLKDMGNWQSVIAWGRFEEIVDESKRKSAVRFLMRRALPIVSSVTTHLGESWPFYSESTEVIDGVIFRIILSERTGRFESTIDSPELRG